MQRQAFFHGGERPTGAAARAEIANLRASRAAMRRRAAGGAETAAVRGFSPAQAAREVERMSARIDRLTGVIGAARGAGARFQR